MFIINSIRFLHFTIKAQYSVTCFSKTKKRKQTSWRDKKISSLKLFLKRVKIKTKSIWKWVYCFFKDSRKASSDLTLRRRFFTKELHIKQSSLTLEFSSLINFSPIGWNDRKIPFLLDDLSTLTLRNSPVMQLFFKIIPRQ